MPTPPPPSLAQTANGAGKLRHINLSTQWTQEKHDLHQLEMRKVLGTHNPADLMTQYLTRTVIDTHIQFMGHQREAGRSRVGLNVQGAANAADAPINNNTGH